jgi:hypothetical protein
MRVLVYFRRNGETNWRELGLQEMKVLLPKGSDVTVEIDGKRTQARVMDRREFVSEQQTPRDLTSTWTASRAPSVRALGTPRRDILLSTRGLIASTIPAPGGCNGGF